MKYGFVTCVELGLSCIRAIYEANGRLDLVITLEDHIASKKSGRVYLDEFCQEKSINLVKCRHINEEQIVNAISEKNIDWLFIIGWSQIAGRKVLTSAAKGVLGMHPTLLPVGRGRAAIPWAILKRLPKTGVTLFKMDEGVDTGLLGSHIEIPISIDETATSLYQKVNQAHYELMMRTICLLENDSMFFVEQDESKATEWPGRKPDDGLINLNGSVKEAELLVRAVTHPYPGAFFFSGGEKVTVWKARLVSSDYTGDTLDFFDGKLELLETSRDINSNV